MGKSDLRQLSIETGINYATFKIYSARGDMEKYFSGTARTKLSDREGFLNSVLEIINKRKHNSASNRILERLVNYGTDTN